jgi:hypothetical protein
MIKTIKSEYNNRSYKVEIIKNTDFLPCDARQIDSILDSKTMNYYTIYQDSSGLYYAINDDEN